MKTLAKTKMTVLLLIVTFLALFVFSTEAMAASKCGYYGSISGGCKKDAISGSSYCKTHTCSASGCNRLTTGGVNSRCDSCQKKYLNDLGITSSGCNFYGCTSRKSSGSYYCSTHTCHHGSCVKKTLSGSRYCSSHTCNGGRSGCYKEVSGANEKCSSCKSKSTSSYSSSSSNTTKKSTTTYKKPTTSTKPKYTMPDCDDYDSYEDFMDEWDGCMPDGSDAEDYWENW